MDNELLTVQTAWKLLYGVEKESIPDINKPENIPYIKAKNTERIDAFKRLKASPARVLFEAWADKIMRRNLALLFTPDEHLCPCPTCSTVREIRTLLNLWMESELIINQGENK